MRNSLDRAAKLNALSCELMLCHAVGREWRWQMDDPESIVEGALGHHVRMINEFKGVPGVMPERLAEGMQVMQ